MNTNAERKATEIRLRAERKAGQMMREMERSPMSKGGDTTAAVHAELPVSEYAKSKQPSPTPRQSGSREGAARRGLGEAVQYGLLLTTAAADWSGQVGRSG
jgi:hypothetical protein